MSKATLYTFKFSVWAAAADVARIELDLADAIEPQQVDLLHAENLSPEFLKKVPSSTLPALIDGSDVYGSTIDVVDYLVKKSSVKVAPRTQLATRVHAEDIDPNFALLAARSDEELNKHAKGLPGVFLSTRVEKLKQFVEHPDAAPFKEKLDSTIARHSGLVAVYHGKAPVEAKEKFFAASHGHFEATRTFLYEELPSAIAEGPFVAGERPGEDDFHVIAWLSRVAAVAGAQKVDDAISALETRFEKPLPEKIKALFQAWVPRESFKSTYEDEKLH